MAYETDGNLNDAALKAHLHRAFDDQIPNFGSYNLVYATGNAGGSGCFIVGFRRQPLELVIAPVNPATLTPRDAAVSINLTNLSHLAEVRDGGFEVGTSTGRVFRFEVATHPSIEVPPSVSPDGGTRTLLEQEIDAEDFVGFMDEFMTRVDELASASSA
ncbi:hypothetical protein [Zhihengliuella halotolerans]|uniref:Uncharacterized protein n=1 Tax=Zhihengliuella halotolerans TaxID=370736 RepID=A0A4Q8ADB0_9MICC|nr:hypothetical protein [Zhihengliuella halotolerans]RZU61613.1 hypothetical protein EV380_1187 [Zhihengliuella halotolerans]